MGSCPCPRCTVAKEDIPGLGTLVDMATRVEKRRADTADRQNRIEKARELIYKDGYVVNSTRVDDLLKVDSLVPTVVCCHQFFVLFLANQ